MTAEGASTASTIELPFHVRPLVTADLPALFRVEEGSYTPDLRETEPAVLSKMALFRAGSLGCFHDDELCGYAFALPWKAGTLIGVAEVLTALPDPPDVLYIHDLVVAPGHRRRGVASTLVAAIVRLADALHLDRLALVAVQNSEPFWERMGFVRLDRFEYVPGQGATRMEMPLHTP